MSYLLTVILVRAVRLVAGRERVEGGKGRGMGRDGGKGGLREEIRQMQADVEIETELSCATPEEGVPGPFIAYFWIGGDEIGGRGGVGGDVTSRLLSR